MFGIRRADLRRAQAADVAGALLGGDGFLRRDERPLVPACRGEHGFGREHLVVDVLVAQNTLHYRETVRLVVDREALREADAVGVAPEDAHARAVERKRPHVASGRAELCLQTGFQLVGSLIRKRDRQHLPRRRRVHGAEPPDGFRRFGTPRSGVLQRGERRLVRPGGKLSCVRTASKADQVFHAVDQNGRFPAPGARQQKKRSLCR